MSRIIKDDTINSIREDYLNGVPIKAIIINYKVSRSFIYNHTRDIYSYKDRKATIYRYLSKEEIKDLQKDYLDGMSIADIVTKYSMKYKTSVYRYIKDLPKRNYYSKCIHKEDMIIDYNNGMSIKDIAKKYNINNPNNVYYYINKQK